MHCSISSSIWRSASKDEKSLSDYFATHNTMDDLPSIFFKLQHMSVLWTDAQLYSKKKKVLNHQLAISIPLLHNIGQIFYVVTKQKGNKLNPVTHLLR